MTRDLASDWQERYASHGTELAFKPATSGRVFSSIEPIFNAPRVVRTTLSPGLVFRDQQMVKDGNDNINLAVSFERGLSLCQHGRDVCLGRNEATMMQADSPGTAGTGRKFNVLEVSISQPEWRMHGPHPHDEYMKVIPRHSESLRLLVGYVGVLAKLSLPGVPETREAVGSHLIDLAVLVATRSSVGESHDGCIVAARRAAALQHIATHFQDPALDGASIAKDLGISKRYLQRLLEETGKSLTEHFTELRLERAFALLGAGRERRVSDIAFEVGFSDITHFYRLFRARFGDTPNGVRGNRKPSLGPDR